MKSLLKSVFVVLIATGAFMALSPLGEAANPVFTSTLRLGSYGDEVLALQKALNADPDTRISGTDVGSPGKEGRYFGALTRDAVMRFQLKYADKILTPNGLAAGTGNVGPSTRNVLNGLETKPTASQTAAPPSGVSSHSIVQSSENPNAKNLDVYIAALTKQARAQGMPEEQITAMSDTVRSNLLSTTTDIRTEFFNQQKELYLKRVSQTSPIRGFVEKAISLFDDTLGVRTALAGIGVPFGGHITYINPFCCLAGSFHIFITLPNPAVNPLFANIFLDYMTGTEGFRWYNIPEPGIATLGTYAPGALICTIPPKCVIPYPALGTITPLTGSSLAP